MLSRECLLVLALSAAAGGIGALALAKIWKGEIYGRTRKSKVADNISELIGQTPLLKIRCLSESTGCLIYGKCEFLNPGGSPKDRVALAIVEDAEVRGVIRPNCGVTLFEGTVGSTGISLATVARARGYDCHIVMPDDQSKEKYAILEALGATVERVRPCSIVDPNHYVNVARRRASERCAMFPDAGVQMGYFCDQFENVANPMVHINGTGREIFEQLDGALDAVVLGAGTGGTIAGISAHVTSRNPNVQVVLADPQGSGMYNKVMHNVMYAGTEKEGQRKRHQVDTIVEGIGQNRQTANFSKALPYIDHAESVTDQEALDMSRFVTSNEGIFCGSSTAVNLVAAYRTAKRLGPGKVIVTILNDPGFRHMTKFWSDEYCRQQSLDVASWKKMVI